MPPSNSATSPALRRRRPPRLRRPGAAAALEAFLPHHVAHGRSQKRCTGGHRYYTGGHRYYCGAPPHLDPEDRQNGIPLL
uniref:Uncharacterized protein n=1 Tax=Setaria viridis TaxID=4556 RepID=A0A4U6VH44_SETVI|nr:hypothetical protein SEVIR_3G360200v2 [Setaria viridis]